MRRKDKGKASRNWRFSPPQWFHSPHLPLASSLAWSASISSLKALQNERQSLYVLRSGSGSFSCVRPGTSYLSIYS